MMGERIEGVRALAKDPQEKRGLGALTKFLQIITEISSRISISGEKTVFGPKRPFSVFNSCNYEIKFLV